MNTEPARHADDVRLYVTRIRGRQPWYCCLRCPSEVRSEAVMQKHVEIHQPKQSADTVRGQLVEAVGEDAAVSVRLWLSDIVEKHTLSADGRTISPSCGWLLDAISPHPAPAQFDGDPRG